MRMRMGLGRLLVIVALQNIATGCAVADEASTTDVLPAYQRYLEIEAAHGNYVEHNELRVHYLEWGDDSSLPLIWLHGKGSSAYELVEVAPDLAVLGLHVISIDLRGHAGTVYKDTDYSVFTMADDVAGVMDELDLSCAVIGGLSFGGGVASAFYDQYPERTVGLLLEDGGNTPYLEVYENIPEEASRAMTIPAFEKSYATQQEAYDAIVPMFSSFLRREQPLPIDLMASFYSWFVPDDKGGWKLHPHNDGFERSPDLPYYSYRNPLPQRSRLFLQPEVIFRNLDVPMLVIDPTGDDENPIWDRKAMNVRLQAMAPEYVIYRQWPTATHAQHIEQPKMLIEDTKLLLAAIREQGTASCTDVRGYRRSKSRGRGR